MLDFADALLVAPPPPNDTSSATILWTLSSSHRLVAAELRRLFQPGWEVRLLRNGRETSVYRFLLRSDAVAYGAQLKRALLADGWTVA